MNAFEYGLENFTNKYQPKPNIVVFNDKTVVLDDFETNEQQQIVSPEEIPPIYIYAEASNYGNNLFSYHKPIKTVNTDYIEQYLIPNGYFEDLGNNNNVVNAIGTYQAYAYRDTFYIKYLNPLYSAEPAVITSKGAFTQKLLAFTEKKLEELINNPDLKFIFFFSDEGSKLEVAYQKINSLKSNEIVFFLENDKGFNFTGSVARILTGSQITKDTALPIKATKNLAQFFNVDVSNNDIKELFDLHLKAKLKNEEKGVSYYLGKIVSAPIEITNHILYGLGWLLEELGDGISSELTFDEKRWKYYDENGEKSKEFSPVFPGFEGLLDHLDKPKEDKDQPKSFDSTMSDLEKKINTFFEADSQTEIGRFFKQKFKFLYKIVKRIKKLYELFKKTFTLKNTLIYINALFIGIVNSLVKAVGGIISLVGNILQIPYHLSELKENNVKSSISAAFELFEEYVEAVFKLFSRKNLIALYNTFVKMGDLAKDFFSNPSQIMSLSEEFAIKALDKTNQAAEYLSTRVDSIGYGLGFAVGFIIEEVVTAIATGGAKTVAGALKFSADSFGKLFKSVGKFAKNGTKAVVNSPLQFFEGLAALFKYLKRLNVEQLLDNFIEWFKKLFTTTKQLAEETFNRIFDKPSSRKRINDAGFTPSGVKGDMVILCPIKP